MARISMAGGDGTEVLTPILCLTILQKRELAYMHVPHRLGTAPSMVPNPWFGMCPCSDSVIKNGDDTHPSIHSSGGLEKMTSSDRVKIAMKVIPEPRPKIRSVLVPQQIPVMKGGGNADMVCGKCGSVLLEGMIGPVRDLVVKCPKCGAYNE